MSKNTQFDGYEWISTHQKAIAMVAAFSGIEFDAVAVSLYDRKHTVGKTQPGTSKSQAKLQHAA